MTVAASFSATLVDEWVRAGLTDAVLAPGSRSTPLAVALARESRIALHVRLDERSAAFFALGIGLATGRPAVLLTTSGTAAVEVHAAVVEAHLSRVPMIVCTADRPPELHHVGAPQTIEQGGLFAGAVRFFAEPGVPDDRGRWSWRSLGSRLVAEATVGPMGPGPVHANLAFREPLLEMPGELPPGRRNGRPWHRAGIVRRVPEPASLDALVGLTRPAARGLIVAGAGAGTPEVVRRLADTLGWPVLADPRSGARVPGAAGAPTVAAADALLRVETLRRQPHARDRPAPGSALGVQGPLRLADILRRGRCRPGDGRPSLGLARSRPGGRHGDRGRPGPPHRGPRVAGARRHRFRTLGVGGARELVGRLGRSRGNRPEAPSRGYSAGTPRRPSPVSRGPCSPGRLPARRSWLRPRCPCAISSGSRLPGRTRPGCSPTAARTG